MIITLTPDDINLAKRMATIRNDKPSRVDKRFTKDARGIDIHYLSALAEVAWRNFTGWPVDDTRRPDGDGGVDFEFEGHKIQIKARNVERRARPDMLCRLDYAKADWYILAEVHPRKPGLVKLAGYCTHSELVSSPKKDLGYGQRYIVVRDKLHPIKR